MIDDMASLKQAMAQMDAPDPAVAEAAKDRAAQILGDAKLSFSKMAELIEQRRLLLRPKIVASLKRMDQPDALGDAAFRDTGSSLRREGQSFGQIAEAIELHGEPAPRYEDPVRTSEPLHQMEMASEPGVPAWLRALAFVARLVFYPVRHPLRFLAIALPAIWLLNAFGFVGVGRQVSGLVDGVAGTRQRVDKAISSVSSFVDKRTSRQPQEAAAPPSPVAIPSAPAAAPSSPDPTASAVPTAPSAPPATAPAPSASEAAPAAPSSTVPAAPPASTPRLDATVAPSRSAANDHPRTVRRRAFEDLMPEEIRRKSRSAGPCNGGAGGCYWGGGRY
jgi:hypothetical protein